MKPKVTMTSNSPWEFEYLKRVIEAVNLKNPKISTGLTWTGNFKLIIEWDEV